MLSLLLHGAAGNLDELLVCGMGLAVILTLVFVVEMRAKNEPAADEPVSGTVKDESSQTLR